MTGILKAQIDALEVPGIVIPRASFYEAQERIYVTLNDKRLIDAGATGFKDERAIRDVAATCFDVPHDVENRQGTFGVFFNTGVPHLPSGMDRDYFSNHHGHDLQVHLGEIPPTFTISTGNRGNPTLLDEQRNRYFTFVQRVHQEFLRQAGAKV